MNAFPDLAGGLASPDVPSQLAACWDVFDAAMRTADAVVWHEGVDAMVALLAGAACAKARNFLPLPLEGTPIPAARLSPEPETANELAALLETATALLGSAARSASPDEAQTYRLAADRATAGAKLLRGMWTSGADG
jgi:hypothetical protein